MSSAASDHQQQRPPLDQMHPQERAYWANKESCDLRVAEELRRRGQQEQAQLQQLQQQDVGASVDSFASPTPSSFRESKYGDQELPMSETKDGGAPSLDAMDEAEEEPPVEDRDEVFADLTERDYGKWERVPSDWIFSHVMPDKGKKALSRDEDDGAAGAGSGSGSGARIGDDGDEVPTKPDPLSPRSFTPFKVRSKRFAGGATLEFATGMHFVGYQMFRTSDRKFADRFVRGNKAYIGDNGLLAEMVCAPTYKNDELDDHGHKVVIPSGAKMPGDWQIRAHQKPYTEPKKAQVAAVDMMVKYKFFVKGCFNERARKRLLDTILCRLFFRTEHTKAEKYHPLQRPWGILGSKSLRGYNLLGLTLEKYRLMIRKELDSLPGGIPKRFRVQPLSSLMMTSGGVATMGGAGAGPGAAGSGARGGGSGKKMPMGGGGSSGGGGGFGSAHRALPGMGMGIGPGMADSGGYGMGMMARMSASNGLVVPMHLQQQHFQQQQLQRQQQLQLQQQHQMQLQYQMQQRQHHQMMLHRQMMQHQQMLAGTAGGTRVGTGASLDGGAALGTAVGMSTGASQFVDGMMGGNVTGERTTGVHSEYALGLTDVLPSVPPVQSSLRPLSTSTLNPGVDGMTAAQPSVRYALNDIESSLNQLLGPSQSALLQQMIQRT
jgi:hypothetical protein